MLNDAAATIFMFRHRYYLSTGLFGEKSQLFYFKDYDIFMIRAYPHFDACYKPSL
jgi:hypothetical protein